MDHGDFHAALLQAVGGFQAEQAAAYHHRLAAAGAGGQHGFGVADVAIADDAGEIAPRQRQHHRQRAGGEQQPVVMGDAAVVGAH